MSKVLLFDFDGVIADSLDVFSASFAKACGRCGVEMDCENGEFLDLFKTNLWEGLAEAGLNVEKLDEFIKVLRGELDQLMRGVQPFKGIRGVMVELGAAHDVYIVTSSVRDVVQRFLDTHGIEGVREVLGAEVEKSKVKKIIALAKRYPDKEVYYIGDTVGDMREGNKAGVKTVGVGWGWHGEQMLRQAGADYVVCEPGQLVEVLSVGDKR